MAAKRTYKFRIRCNKWLVAQNPSDFKSFEDPTNPLKLAGIHTELIFTNMWAAADVLTTRQIEVWHDDQGRFSTCDAPVLVPFDKSARHDLHSAPYVVWPVSPHRVVALSNDLIGEKAVIREATGKMVGIVRQAIEQGRERTIFASAEQRNRLTDGKTMRRRPQARLRCSGHTPMGERVPSSGCCVEFSEGFGTGPDVVLCDRGLHSPAPQMLSMT